jgi:hypothetical protein
MALLEEEEIAPASAAGDQQARRDHDDELLERKPDFFGAALSPSASSPLRLALVFPWPFPAPRRDAPLALIRGQARFRMVNDTFRLGKNCRVAPAGSAFLPGARQPQFCVKRLINRIF